MKRLVLVPVVWVARPLKLLLVLALAPRRVVRDEAGDVAGAAHRR